MNEKAGSVLGGMLLIAGSCIGAGMLGLPILTGLVGFAPSLLLFFLAWLFMTSTALLLVEVNGWFSKRVNFLSMVNHSLGKWGKATCWVTYLFLFYALLVAYISGSGSLFSTFLQAVFHFMPPIWACSLFFVVLFGSIVFFGTRQVDLCNRGLMFAKILFFALLVLAGVQFIEPEKLTRVNMPYAASGLPLLVIAFGFHNMIPSLTDYMKGNLRRVRLTIIGGSLMAMGIYLVWQVLVLGIVPLEGPDGLFASLCKDQEASQAISAIVGSSWIRTFAQGLAFFAILTSFLAQALSLVHFLSDGLKITYKKGESPWMCALALLPPLVLALIYPQLFFKALNFAGGICAVILFGLLPVAMVWIGRYYKKEARSYRLIGGKPALVGICLFALLILFVQLSTMLGAPYLPTLCSH
ncbi:MAG: tyrosine transporter [Verrucomicrobia bacterium]|nr:tyrosine transporter [Verrucomicrobiota bacterium]